MENKLEILKSVSEYILKLNIAIEDASTYMDNDKVREGYDLVTKISDGLVWVIDVINLTEDLNGEKKLVDKILEYSMEIIEAIEENEYILVGDLLKYEIRPILENINRKIINELQKNS
ncbi:MAG: hypothetical protein ACRCWG_07210 [Sarcina sp.]